MPSKKSMKIVKNDDYDVETLKQYNMWSNENNNLVWKDTLILVRLFLLRPVFAVSFRPVFAETLRPLFAQPL